MHSQNNTSSTGDIIHKKKEAKKNLKAKGLLPIELLNNRTIGLGYHTSQGANVQGSEELEDNRQPDPSRTRNQLINHEIDEYLQELIITNMIDERFTPFYAKACHQLGVTKVQQIRINTLASPKLKDAQRLFAYKVKGALQLHYKRQFEAE